jgi:stalled ribosome rescue protein Dom34
MAITIPVMIIFLLGIWCHIALAPEKEKARKAIDEFSFSTPNPYQYWTTPEIHPGIFKINRNDLTKVIFNQYSYSTIAMIGMKEDNIKFYYINSIGLKELNICGIKGKYKRSRDRGVTEEYRLMLLNIAKKLTKEQAHLLLIGAKELNEKSDYYFMKYQLEDIEIIYRSLVSEHSAE